MQFTTPWDSREEESFKLSQFLRFRECGSIFVNPSVNNSEGFFIGQAKSGVAINGGNL